MNLLNNVAGAFGLSHGNMISKAMKFVGLPEGLASAVGLVMDVKNGNIASALFKTGPALLKALSGGQAGQANSVERPSSFLGTIAKVAGFAGVAALAAPLIGSLLPGVAGGGLSTMMKGGLGIAAALGFTAVAGKAGGFMMEMVGLGGPGGAIGANTLIGNSRTQGGTDSMLARLPKPAMFEDIVAAFMVDFVKDKQNEIEKKLDGLRQSAQNAGKTGGDKAGGFFGGLLNTITGGITGKARDAENSGSAESRNIEFEMLKNEMQKLSQMQQAMSGVLNAMNDTAMNAIRSIK